MRNSRFEGLTNRSPLLAQILEQMQQHSVYQPQSYGALAAGLGASYLQQKTLHNELMKEQKAKEAQGQGLAQALSKFQQDSQGGMQSLPGTGVQLDTLPDPNARQNLMGSLVQNENPMAQGLASQLMAQQFAPPSAPEAYTLSPGQSRFQGGQQVASMPAAPEKPLSTLGQLQADRDAGRISPEQYDLAIQILRKPLVSMDQGGPQFPSPPTGTFRPDKNKPGLAPEPGAPPAPGKEPSGEIKAKLGLLNSAKESLNEAKGILFKDGAYRGGLASQLMNPLRTGPAADLYNSMNEAMSNRLRAESGANISDAEIQSQTDRFLPKPWDSKEVAENKFMRFQRFIDQYESAVSYDPAQPKVAPQTAAKTGNTLRFDSKGNPL